MTAEALQTLRDGYVFDGPTLESGVALVGDEPSPDTLLSIPLPMLTPHSLITGATGTGKSVTL